MISVRASFSKRHSSSILEASRSYNSKYAFYDNVHVDDVPYAYGYVFWLPEKRGFGKIINFRKNFTNCNRPH